MSDIYRLTALVAVCLLALNSSAAVAQTQCPSDMVLLADEYPTLPPILHNTYSGYALVSFHLDAIGRVSAPQVLSSEWTPVGNARGSVARGYEEAIVEAATKWRYPPGIGPCIGTRRFEMVWK